MSLNWDISEVKDLESIKTEEEWPKTEALIWQTMFVDMGSITEENYVEFFMRMRILAAVQDLTFPPYPFDLTIEDVERRIGLHTNVSNVSMHSFLMKLKTHVKKQKLRYEHKRKMATLEAAAKNN